MNVTVNAQGVLTTLDTSKAPPVDPIIAYEAGELSEEDVIDLFQHGIDNGWVWSLQGAYGRQAQRLLDVDPVTLTRMARDGRLPAPRVQSGRRVWTVGAIRAHLAAGEAAARRVSVYTLGGIIRAAREKLGGARVDQIIAEATR